MFLSHADCAIDRESLRFVVADEAYATDYAGAVARGTRTVISYEPEHANVKLLERAAAGHRKQDADSRVRQAAVGSKRGEAELHVMKGGRPTSRSTSSPAGLTEIPSAMAPVLRLRRAGASRSGPRSAPS